MQIQPYLFFEGRCEEAAEFYRRALGAETKLLLRYRDAPDGAGCAPLPPGSDERVMHLELQLPGGAALMASDGRCCGQPRFDGVALSLQARDADEAERLFAALADGGEVRMPLAPTFFSPRFGMLADRFGVSWMVGVAAP